MFDSSLGRQKISEKERLVDIPLYTFVAYFNKGILRFGFVTATKDSYSEILTEDGTTTILSNTRFILTGKETLPNKNIVTFVSEVNEQAEQFEKTDFSFLADREYTLVEIVEELKLQSDVEIFALYKFLRAHPEHIKCKKHKYRLKTTEEIALFQIQQKEQEEEELFLQEVNAWFKGSELSIENQHQLFCALPELQSDKKNKKLLELILANYPHHTPEQAILQFRKACGETPYYIDPIISNAGIPIGFSTLLNNEKLLPIQNSDPEETAFCIDDESTRDFDDALSIAKDGSFWKVGIYVSSVSERLNLQGALFAEAKKRVSSLYTANAIIPLFPQQHSEKELCLLKNELRPVIALTLWLDSNFNIQRTEIARKKITISANYSYPEVDKHIAQEPFATLFKFSKTLAEKREANSVPEEQRYYYYIVSTKKGLAVKCIDTQSPARKMVEELMIVYNSSLAAYSVQENIPIIYRNINHIETLNTNLVISQAYLSTSPQFHPGIGVKAYMHTTSPIRRYVDLINQTQILANLKGKTKPFSNEELENDIPRIEKTLLYLKETAHKSEHYWVLEFLKQNYLNTPLDAYFRDGRNGFLRFELIPWGFVISAKCESYPLTDKLKIIIYKVDSDQGYVWADLL